MKGRTMKPDDLHFKWDPHAKKNAVRSKGKKQKKPRRLEDYFNFLEQFSFSGEENKPDQHVDKKFTLSK
jgi:hypothetical protein